MARGRDKELIRRRNQKLLRRYIELTEVDRLRFDDALRLLSEEEFFISEQRVLAVIRTTRLEELPKPAKKHIPKINRLPVG